MCGITGFYTHSGIPKIEERLEIEIKVQNHRGPDAEGSFISKDKRIGLGHFCSTGHVSGSHLLLKQNKKRAFKFVSSAIKSDPGVILPGT